MDLALNNLQRLICNKPKQTDLLLNLLLSIFDVLISIMKFFFFQNIKILSLFHCYRRQSDEVCDWNLIKLAVGLKKKMLQSNFFATQFATYLPI